MSKFSEFLGTLNSKFRYKVVINGNHELSFDDNCTNFRKPREIGQNPRELLKNCIYLEDSSVELFGIKIYGSPWTPNFHDWGHNLERGEQILAKWNKIPDDTRVLISESRF